MLIVMSRDASPEQIGRVVAAIVAEKLTAHPLPGPTRTAIGITGNTGAVSKALFEVLPGVESAIRVTKPFKLASREMKREETVVSHAVRNAGRLHVHRDRRAVLRRERGRSC